MSRESAGCTRELAQVFLRADGLDLALETVDEDREFLAHGGWGCWLAVGAAEHWNGCVGGAHFAQLGEQTLNLWQPHLGYCIANGDRVREVVDVFRGASKVSELEHVLAADAG